MRVWTPPENHKKSRKSSIVCKHRLESAKSTGIDGLGSRIIKLAAHCISPSLAAFINKSIKTGHFSSQMKMPKAHPIYKNGDKTDPSNYRPLSIVPTISFYFEKHVNDHLMAY